jgi:acetyl-CoA C-acetyltransferase
MSSTVIVDGLRSPFGKLGGVLSAIPAVDLAVPLVKELVSRHKIDVNAVVEVILGQVIQAGAGQIPSRQVLIKAGLPTSCESSTVNKVCASGMLAVAIADLRVRTGEGDLFLAGGMESMSQAPYLVDANTARFGKKLGHSQFKDAVLADGLECPFFDCHMAVHAAKVAEEYKISREDQDKWALRSHQLCLKAQQSGRFKKEILPVTIKQKGKEIVIENDEGPRADTSLEALAKLKPVFYEQGTVTAGNAPGINDGACLLLLMSEEKAKALGMKPLAKILAHASLGQDVPYLATAPANAIKKAVAKCGLTVPQLDLIEINEAFAAVALTSMRMLQVDPEKVNVNGGAVAMGHPLGASGARILLTLALEMEARGAKYGATGICSGTGQGDSIILSREGL